MKNLTSLIVILFVVVTFNISANAQYGNEIYRTWGNDSYALQMQLRMDSLNNHIRNLQKRDAAKSSSSGSKTQSSSSHSSQNNQSTLTSPKYYGRFRRDNSVDMAKTISEVFTNPQERRQLKTVVENVQQLYRETADSLNWGNNVAGGMTFFLITMSMVYHETPQPNDETFKTIYEAVNLLIDDIPDFAMASDKDKTKLNDMLVGISALPFMTYVEGKKGANRTTVQTARTLAGEMIKWFSKPNRKMSGSTTNR